MSTSTDRPTLLVVDDSRTNRLTLSRFLQGEFGEVLEAENGEVARRILVDERKTVHLVLLDMMMPVMGGMDLLRILQPRLAELPVVVLSASQDLRPAIEAMRLGARDYFEKPFEPEILMARIRAVLRERKLRAENADLRRVLADRPATFSLIGQSKAMGDMMLTVNKVARSASTVLVHGETGSGKEMVARAIHWSGPRAAEPFQVVDCASLPATMIESELFGHEKGSFTGAVGKKQGLMLAAGKGTVFLDEIGELPLDMQAKLLRVLQEKQVRAVGASEYLPLEARLVAATNRDLHDEVRAGRFREDLYHRLNVVQVHLPPLRDRREDIPHLIEYFLTKHSVPGSESKSVSPQVLRELESYDWPGNVRELENAIERAINLSDSEELVASDILPADWQDAQLEPPSSMDAQILTLSELERQGIERALRASSGNRRAAAQLVGIGEATLYRKIKEYGLKE